MLKNWIGFTEKDVDSFILDLKEMVMREEDDVARALAGLEPPYEVLEEFCPFVSEFADHLINPDLSEQERKRRKAKMLNANVSDVLGKVDEFQPLGMYDARASVKGNNVESKDMLQFDRLVGLGFSEPMIDSIKTKAHKLVAGGLVTRAFSGDESRSVKSFSSNKPTLCSPTNILDTNVTILVCNTKQITCVHTLWLQRRTRTKWKSTQLGLLRQVPKDDWRRCVRANHRPERRKATNKKENGDDHLHSLQKSQLALQSIYGVSPVTPFSSCFL